MSETPEARGTKQEQVDEMGHWLAHFTAIEAVAAEALYRFAADADFAEWEDFGDIGEFDWDQVLEQIKKVARQLRPSDLRFEWAYEWLAAQANQDEPEEAGQ